MRNKRLRTVILLAGLAVILAGAGALVRGVILHRIRAVIGASFHYGAIRLSAIPPSLSIEDIRTVSASPFFSARRISARLSLFGFFARNRSISLRVESPVLRISESDAGGGKRAIDLGTLPFSIERGTLEDGEVYYFGRAGTYLAKGIRAAFRRSGDSLILRAESEDNAWLMPALQVPISGRISALLEGRGKDIIIRKAVFSGPDLILKAEATLSDLSAPRIDLRASVRAPAALVADLFDLPFRWSGRIAGDGRIDWRDGRASVEAELRSGDLGLSDILLGRVEGKLTVSPDRTGRIDLTERRFPAPDERVSISFGEGKVSGTAEGFHIDPVIRDLRLPWPVKSPAWGTFTFANRQLDVEAEFRDELMIASNGRYPVRGSGRLTWDGGSGIRFSAPEVETSFGSFGVEGEIDVGRRVKIGINGEASDVREGRAFAELILGLKFGFPEVRGRGRTEMTIEGDYHSPGFRAEFDAAPAGFERFDAAHASGTFSYEGGVATGRFQVQDPDMRGEVDLTARGENYDVKIRAEEGAAERILRSLDIDFPLAARGAGEFTLTGRPEGMRVAGTFAAASAAVAGAPFTDVRGSLEWDGASSRLAFPSLEGKFFGGSVKGAGSIGFRDRSFAIDDLIATAIDLSRLEPKIAGRVSFSLTGAGLLDRDAASGPFTLSDAAVGPLSGLQASGRVEVRYPAEGLSVRLSGALNPDLSEFSASFAYPQPDGGYAAEVKGRWTQLDRLVPLPGIRGEMNYLLNFKGGRGPAQLTGVVDVKGPLLPIPKFAQSVDDYSGLVFIQNDRATIRSLRAKLGGGDVSGTGEIRFGGGGIASLDVRAEGKDMILALLERARARADGSLRLIKNESRFLLSGDIHLRDVLWRREITEKFSFTSEPDLGSLRTPGIFDDMELDIRLHGDQNAVAENALGRIQGRFDLTVSGRVNAPVLLGDIEGQRGSVVFQDRDFRVLRARLSFINPSSIEPYVDFLGETFLKDYRVTFSLSGLPDRLRPEFSSSPPLPSEDVLALLALGESFKRTYSYDTSSQMGTGSLLSFQLGEEAAKRAERLFSLDRFRIDPFVLGASTEMTARLTVGKKISRNIILLYSTNLTSQREEIIRLEWEFSESFSLIGMRDERGRISFDAKLRKRF